MRCAGGIAALAAASMSSAAVAETAAQAFECNLTREAAMAAAAKLAVTKQSTEPENFLVGAVTTIEFAPNAKIFGQTPTRLYLTFLEPTASAKQRYVSITFNATLPRTDAADKAIMSSAFDEEEDWSQTSYRRSNIEGDYGSLEYQRNDGSELRLSCNYIVAEADLAP